MDWLNWAIRLATVFGLTVFCICAFLGAQSLIAAWRVTLEIWKAKQRFQQIKAGGKDFQDHLDKNV
jgi:hypothetical protein